VAENTPETRPITEFGDPDKTLVRYETRGAVAWITLDDPPVNGYTYRMMRQLDEAILRARFDRDVEVIALTGHGRFFCAGANIKMLEQADPVDKYYFCLHANETLSRLEQTPKLVVGVINGHCVGGGFEVAMAADLRVAKRGAGKIGLPEVNLGVLPGTGGTQRLARLVGKSKAIELMATGATVDFETAESLGLVNTVFDAETFDSEVEAYLDQFTTPRRATMAVGHIKRAVQTGAELPLEAGLTLERELQAKLFASDDAREGLEAFVGKRDPEFSGS